MPGDARGFVGNVREKTGRQVVHNMPGTPYDADKPRLERWVRTQMNGPAVTLGCREAEAMIAQYRATARIRQWAMQAASVMHNHTHIVVGAGVDLDPRSVLKTLKNWATRAVTQVRALPANGTFWTANGSKRRLSDDAAVRAAVIYVVKKQPHPLAVWFDPCWREALDGWAREQRE